MRPGQGLNSSSWVRQALLHMVPECFDHWATRAGRASIALHG